MPKINQEEYEVLKEALNEGYEWIARDSHNPLCTHRHKPVKQEHWIQQYWGNAGNGYKEIDDRLFRFIQWEDEEPYNIAELIEEYEYSALERHVNSFKELSKAIRTKESEETEVKNIEWLKEKIQDIHIQEDISTAVTGEEFDLIDQLDEPQTNSQIDKLANFIMSEVEGEPSQNQGAVDTAIRIIKSYQNQETLSQELPVIPNYVAKWISEHHERFDLYPALKKMENNSRAWGKNYETYDWYRKNTPKFVNAYLTGKYEVEEEQKYRVLDGNTTLLGRINGLMLTTVEILEYYPEYAPTFDLTEQEIKDYDPRYMAFAKPVEEVK